MTQSAPQIIQGGFHSDERGSIAFVNSFVFEGVKRFYSILHPNTETVRAWQGHKLERKWFFVASGSFKLVLVKIGDWNTPLADGQPYEYLLDEEKPKILAVPGGYVNGFQATSPNSRLMVFSDASVEESVRDDYRFEKNLWYRW
ncbi:WxcM-like domain-containing protein [Lunatimonas salinarum]|uniref:WxcM-like domain-containing protein n=1 Tax=Lunatimonas salinarum TaxID=1774590 RepID=UPI001ADECF50|nr:WxcM-like domain-containing protein [Lunatimonas salinarum]